MASYTRDAGSYGPTRIATATREFESALRGVLERLNAVIREAIVDEDIFGLQNEALAERDDVDGPTPFVFNTDPEKVDGFVDWLREQLESAYLSLVGPDENPYIRKAYVEGARRATREVRDQGVDVEAFSTELLDTYTNRQALQDLYTRTFEDLESVTEDIATGIREELSTALIEGENPRKVARRLVDRVNAIGKHRSTLIARTEMMEAHSNAEINRLRQVEDNNDVTVGVEHGTWETAHDDDVCAICRALQGITFTLDEFENGSFRIGGYDYQLKPPAHPNGRCHIQVQVGFDPTDLEPLEARMPDDVEAVAVAA